MACVPHRRACPGAESPLLATSRHAARTRPVAARHPGRAMVGCNRPSPQKKARPVVPSVRATRRLAPEPIRPVQGSQKTRFLIKFPL